MSMVCPQCNDAFDQALECPECGVRLHYRPRSRPVGGESSRAAIQWQQSYWGRIIVGVLLSQGLAHGMERLFTAGILATTDQGPGGMWATLWGLVLLQAFYGISLLIGGALTAAGQRNGILLGTVVGLASGFAFLAIRMLKGEAMTEVMVYGQPLLHLIFGGLGGLIGSAIWRPLPVVEVKLPAPDKNGLPASAKSPAVKAFEGPIHWGRVVCGTIVVVSGVMWPKAILDFVMEASQGQLSINNTLQSQLITWEITGLITLIGAAIAGATTRNGLKQGLAVGVGASILLIGVRLGNRNHFAEHTLFLVVTILSLALLGSWFGGQLFPPIKAKGRRRHLESAAM